MKTSSPCGSFFAALKREHLGTCPQKSGEDRRVLSAVPHRSLLFAGKIGSGLDFLKKIFIARGSETCMFMQKIERVFGLPLQLVRI